MEEGKIIAKILKKPLEEGELRQSLEQLKLKPTYENAILLQMVRKAAAGDLTAAKYILDASRAPQAEPAGGDLSELTTGQLRQMLM